MIASSLTDEDWTRILHRKAGGAEPPEMSPLVAAYARLAAPTGVPFVFGQVGQSLDGRVATPAGDARDVSSPDGLAHLHRCRALADAVLVGVGTVVADDPRLTVRLVPGDNPVRVVVDPDGRSPEAADVLVGKTRTLVVCADDCTRDWPVEAIRLPRRAGRLDPSAIVAALAERGLRRLLVEGGAGTLGAFIKADCLDRLHVTVAPLIIGSGPCGLSLSPIARLTEAVRPVVEVHLLGRDVLFDCDLRA